jgi:hypothetical protein
LDLRLQAGGQAEPPPLANESEELGECFGAALCANAVPASPIETVVPSIGDGGSHFMLVIDLAEEL